MTFLGRTLPQHFKMDLYHNFLTVFISQSELKDYFFSISLVKYRNYLSGSASVNHSLENPQGGKGVIFLYSTTFFMHFSLFCFLLLYIFLYIQYVICMIIEKELFVKRKNTKITTFSLFPNWTTFTVKVKWFVRSSRFKGTEFEKCVGQKCRPNAATFMCVSIMHRCYTVHAD